MARKRKRVKYDEDTAPQPNQQRLAANVHYRKLGLKPTADATAIKSAYHKLALVHHPDRGGDAAVFRELATAYQTVLTALDGPPQDAAEKDQLSEDDEQSWSVFASGGIFANPCSDDDEDQDRIEEVRAERRAGRAERKRLRKADRREEQRTGGGKGGKSGGGKGNGRPKQQLHSKQQRAQKQGKRAGRT